jgi:predicted nucleic acid-binding protein
MARVITLDTNTALLYIAGQVDIALIDTHKRLKSFDRLDFLILSEIVERYDQLVLVPHALAETYSLLNQIGDPARRLLRAALGMFVLSHEEIKVVSRAAVERAEYHWLGLTDCVLLEVAATGVAILTADVKLYLAANNARYEAINYNHIRDKRADYR